jgi:hypothetical protein
MLTAAVALLVTIGVDEVRGSPTLSLDGDVGWVVPPELFRPSEAMSDEAEDTAQTLALRDVELDWYKVGQHRRCCRNSFLSITCLRYLTHQ